MYIKDATMFWVVGDCDVNVCIEEEEDDDDDDEDEEHE